MQFLVLFTVALVPLLITPGVFFFFDITPKIIILLLDVCVMLWFCDKNVKNIRGLLSTAPGRWFAGFLTLQWTSFLISTILSTEPPLSLNGSSWRGYGLVTETAVLLFTLLSTAWLAMDRRRTRFLL